jgi:hypothetical protein
MCRIKNNVLVGRIVPRRHSAQPVLESRVFCHEAIAKRPNPAAIEALTPSSDMPPRDTASASGMIRLPPMSVY